MFSLILWQSIVRSEFLAEVRTQMIRNHRRTVLRTHSTVVGKILFIPIHLLEQQPEPQSYDGWINSRKASMRRLHKLLKDDIPNITLAG